MQVSQRIGSVFRMQLGGQGQGGQTQRGGIRSQGLVDRIGQFRIGKAVDRVQCGGANSVGSGFCSHQGLNQRQGRINFQRGDDFQSGDLQRFR